jgi:hypothetical protein
MAKQMWVSESGEAFETEELADQHDQVEMTKEFLTDCLDRSYDVTIKNIMNHPRLAITVLPDATESTEPDGDVETKED